MDIRTRKIKYNDNKLLIKIPVIFVSLLMLFILPAVAQDNNIQVNALNIKYIGYDSDNNAYRLRVDISLNKEANIKYIEEYYDIKNRYPVFYTSKTHFEGTTTLEDSGLYNVSFEILRPNSGYSLVKAIIMSGDRRIIDPWLTKNKDFIDNTASAEDTAPKERAENLEKFEIQENPILNNEPMTFHYNTLGIISNVNVVGSSNYDSLSLRINLFKDVPDTVYAPSGLVYKYFEMSSDNYRIKEVIPEFRIDNPWITNNNITAIIMLEWNEDTKEWNPLITKYLSKDDSYVYFSSNSSGLSTFAIVGFNPQLANAQQQNSPQKQPQSAYTPTYTPTYTPSNPTIYTPTYTPIYTPLYTPESSQTEKIVNKIINGRDAILIAIIAILLIYTFKIRK